MKQSYFITAILSLLLIIGFVFLAPRLVDVSGAGFLDIVGLRRGLVFGYALALLMLLCIYQIISADIGGGTKRENPSQLLKVAISQGIDAFAKIRKDGIDRGSWRTVFVIASTFIAIFFVFLSKYRNGFESDWTFDQDWHQGFVDYDALWHSPFFYIPGNILYSFDIRFPLNSRILPVHAFAELFPQSYRWIAADFLLFCLVGILYWFFGQALRLRRVPCAIFAGCVALMVSVPSGPELLFWLFQPKLFTRQFVFAIWWGEVPQLFFAATLLFYHVGRCRTGFNNFLVAAVFFIFCWLLVLGAPVGAVYFVPLTALYCGVLYVTSTARLEWLWKTAASLFVMASMLLAGVPSFLSGLYNYAYGVFFFEWTQMSGGFWANFPSIWIFTTRGMASFDLRGVFIYCVAMTAVLTAVFCSSGVT